jgi:transcriptional repressor NF-X1
LSCGNHHCSKVCHEDACGICELSPEVVVSCPCGRLKVTSEQRKSCLDPVPTCKAVCGKMLSCGPIAQPHTCLLRYF